MLPLEVAPNIAQRDNGQDRLALAIRASQDPICGLSHFLTTI